MKRISYLFVLATSLLMGCSKFLDRDPMDFVSPSNFSSENDIVLALNGTYKALLHNLRFPIYTDFMTDNGIMIQGFSGEIDFWDQVQNPNSILTVSKWNQNYAGILRANTVLRYAPEIPMEENKRNTYLGEALFLRAFFYADLVDFYGDVPYRVEPDGLEAKDSPRVDKAVILEGILADLDQAIEYLPGRSQTEPGRATKGAALTLKGKILLYNERWEEAAAAFQAVVDLGEYAIYPDYYAMFSGEQAENNIEVIFDMQFLKNQAGRGLSHQWMTFFLNWSSYMGLANLEREYYMTNGKPIGDPDSGYDPQDPWTGRDPRLGYNFTLPYTPDGTNTNGTIRLYVPNSRASANFSSLRIRKWVDYSDDNVLNISGNNIILLRYADVLLMRAEALLESPNWATHRDEIISLVNEVRQRPSVGMPTVQEAEGEVADQDLLRQIIRHERRVEFAYEGTRMSDVRRWQIGPEAYTPALGYRPQLLITNPANSRYELYSFRQRTFNTQKGYLWPIPLEEMQSNLAITANNPGY